MQWMPLHVLILLAVSAVPSATSSDNTSCLHVEYPSVLLSGVAFSLTVSVSPFPLDTAIIPISVTISVYNSDNGNLTLLFNMTTTTRQADGTAQLSVVLSGITVDRYGYNTLVLEITDAETSEYLAGCPVASKAILVIPGWLSILPPIITTIVAIVFKQVILALLLGIWVGSFFANECNPLTAAMRTLDTYYVRSISSRQYAPIIAAAMLIGGLIAVVQKSGGAFGMAKLISRFANSHRKACIACFILCLCIFFDDFIATLVIGYTSRKVMSDARVSKDKFAFIIRSMAYTMCGLVPLSSAVGGQIGYIMSGFNTPSCGNTAVNGYLILLKALPYQFLPLLMIACVFLVCMLGRDFGPMLTSERLAKKHQVLIEDSSFDVTLAIKGPLAPKANSPKRWFNGVLPFVVMITACLAGMLASGYARIDQHNSQRLAPGDDIINVTVVNMLSNGDALSAILWGTFLATVLLMLMLMAQRILSFSEFLEAWLEGVRGMTEPITILLLSFAFGYVIEDIQTSNFIAQGLRGGLPPEYIPAITTIIGYIIAYAVGAAFGGLGILFPLIIPIVCQLTPDEDNTSPLRIQTAAAILSSAMIGTMMSPMAPHAILVKASTDCDISSHLKTTSLYVLLVGFLAVLFGALPVGAGWYPWYVGWILMLAALIAVFVLFSSGHTATSRSLCRIGCPCLFTLVTKLLHSLSGVRKLVTKYFKRRHKGTLIIQGKEIDTINNAN